jgi:hypothetical protein
MCGGLFGFQPILSVLEEAHQLKDKGFYKKS